MSVEDQLFRDLRARYLEAVRKGKHPSEYKPLMRFVGYLVVEIKIDPMKVSHAIAGVRMDLENRRFRKRLELGKAV